MRRLLREPVTLGLIALCVAWTLGAKALDLGYFKAGALTGRLLWEGQWWRLFSAMFLHHMESFIHLVANALSLFFVGRVIERGCGRPVLLACVFGSATAGFAASLVVKSDPRVLLMGISGGIAGLLGLLLAVEWAVTKSFKDFLKQRNTILIAAFLALSIPIAMLVEGPGIRVDHTGHAGGFLCGLLAGLAHYTRRGVRRTRGVVVLLALSILPAAYASHPVLDPHYRIWRARRAYHAGDYEAAAKGLERAREMDKALFDREGAREELVDSYLRLAAAHLPGPEATRLVEAAYQLGGRDHGPWMRFAAAAEERAPETAYLAWLEAARHLPAAGAWVPLARALKLLEARKDPPLLEMVAVARGAAVGLLIAPPADFEAAIAAAADAVAAKAEDASPDLARGLSDLYRLLADNSGEDARRPRYRLRSAEWLWAARRGGGPGGPDDEVQARFRAALTEAALYGDPRTKEAATRWFQGLGIPVPEPDLEGEEGGG